MGQVMVRMLCVLCIPNRWYHRPESRDRSLAVRNRAVQAIRELLPRDNDEMLERVAQHVAVHFNNVRPEVCLITCVYRTPDSALMLQAIFAN